jgi:glycosyltransferase involved in cell wall biosynthesis
VELVQPERRLGLPVNPHRGLAKWLAYADKFLLFPARLRRIAAAHLRDGGPPVVYHVCDHSNAPLLGALAGKPTVATCHDMLAILGALGQDPWCPASASGKKLQRWILRHLASASGVCCDSTHTRTDFQRLTGRVGDPLVRTVLLPLNNAIASDVADPGARLLQALPELGGLPYLLHVGSSLPRKNRGQLLRVAAELASRGRRLAVVYAGDGVDPDLRAEAARLGVADRVHAVEAPDAALLRSLYLLAHALVFPSHGEGFGYPILEAQACACPVVASDATSLPEVAGAGARLHPPLDAAGMAESCEALFDPRIRDAVVTAGTGNLKRFSEAGLASGCLDLHRDVLAKFAVLGTR